MAPRRDPEVLEFLEHLHTAAEAAGGMEITLGALEAAGFTGLGPLVGDAAAVTAAAYAGAVAGCIIGAGVVSVSDLLAQNDVSPEVRDIIVTAANDAGVPVDEANA
jgi:hypothetical protein